MNRLTVRLAINKLNTLGLLETRTGEGTYVKRLNVYNYINQIIPFVLSTHEIGHIKDFEKSILNLELSAMSFSRDEELFFDNTLENTEKNVEKLKSIHSLTNSYNKEVVEDITVDFSKIKDIIFQKVKNPIMKSMIISLKELLYENDIEEINNMDLNELDNLVTRIEVLKRRAIGEKIIMDKSLIKVDVEVNEKKDAVRVAGEILHDNGLVEKRYIDAMISAMDEFGPYIVITKGVALPHARPEEGVLKSGFSIVRLKEPVIFGNEENDPVKLVIALSSVGNEEHIKNIQKIITILDDKTRMEVLLNGTVNDIYQTLMEVE